MAHAAAIWFVVARLCFPFPQSPEGFACLTHRYAWYEGEAPKIEAAGHPIYAWRDVEMVWVPIPGVKPPAPVRIVERKCRGQC